MGEGVESTKGCQVEVGEVGSVLTTRQGWQVEAKARKSVTDPNISTME